MEHSVWRIERHLTPELFDHYVARAREERAAAVAGFFGHLATAVSRMVGRVARRARPLDGRISPGQQAIR